MTIEERINKIEERLDKIDKRMESSYEVTRDEIIYVRALHGLLLYDKLITEERFNVAKAAATVEVDQMLAELQEYLNSKNEPK